MTTSTPTIDDGDPEPELDELHRELPTRGSGPEHDVGSMRPKCSVEHRPVQSPFFGLGFDISRDIPARHPSQA